MKINTAKQKAGLAGQCPKRSKHTPAPPGYLQWHEWATKKGKTHRTVRCSGCHLFTIWVPKKRRAAKGTT